MTWEFFFAIFIAKFEQGTFNLINNGQPFMTIPLQ